MGRVSTGHPLVRVTHQSASHGRDDIFPRFGPILVLLDVAERYSPGRTPAVVHRRSGWVVMSDERRMFVFFRVRLFNNDGTFDWR